MDKWILGKINETKPIESELNLLGINNYGASFNLKLKGKDKIKYLNSINLLNDEFEELLEIIKKYNCKFKYKDKVIPFWRLQAQMRIERGLIDGK